MTAGTTQQKKRQKTRKFKSPVTPAPEIAATPLRRTLLPKAKASSFCVSPRKRRAHIRQLHLGKYLPPSFFPYLVEATSASGDGLLYFDKGLTGIGFTYGMTSAFIDRQLPFDGDMLMIEPNRAVAVAKLRQAVAMELANPVRRVNLTHRIGPGSDVPSLPQFVPGLPVLTISVIDGLALYGLPQNLDFCVLDEAHRLITDASHRAKAFSTTMKELRGAVPVLQVTATPVGKCDLVATYPTLREPPKPAGFEYFTGSGVNADGTIKNAGGALRIRDLQTSLDFHAKDPSNRCIFVLATSATTVAAVYRWYRSHGLRVAIVAGATVRLKLLNILYDDPPFAQEPSDINDADVVIATKAGCDGYDLRRDAFVIITSSGARSKRYALTDCEIVQALGRCRGRVHAICYPVHPKQGQLTPSGRSAEQLEKLGFRDRDGSYRLSAIADPTAVLSDFARAMHRASLTGVFKESVSACGATSEIRVFGRTVRLDAFFQLDADGNPSLHPEPAVEGALRLSSDPVPLLRSRTTHQRTAKPVTDSKRLWSFRENGGPDNDEPQIGRHLDDLITADGVPYLVVDRQGHLDRNPTAPAPTNPRIEALISEFLRLFGRRSIVSGLRGIVKTDNLFPSQKKLPGGSEHRLSKVHPDLSLGNPWFPVSRSGRRRKLLFEHAGIPTLYAAMRGLARLLAASGYGDRNMAQIVVEGMESFDTLHAGLLDAIETDFDHERLRATYIDLRKKALDSKKKARTTHTREKAEGKADELSSHIALLDELDWLTGPLLVSLLGIAPMPYKRNGARDFNLLSSVGSLITEELARLMPFKVHFPDLRQIAPNTLLASCGVSRDVNEGDLYAGMVAALLKNNPGADPYVLRKDAKRQVGMLANYIYPKPFDLRKRGARLDDRSSVYKHTHGFVTDQLRSLVDLGILPAEKLPEARRLYLKIGSNSEFYYRYASVEKRLVNAIAKATTIPFGHLAATRLHDAFLIADRFTLVGTVDELVTVPQIEARVSTELGVGTLSGFVPEELLEPGRVELDSMTKVVVGYELKVPGVDTVIARSWTETITVSPDVEEFEEQVAWAKETVGSVPTVRGSEKSSARKY